MIVTSSTKACAAADTIGIGSDLIHSPTSPPRLSRHWITALFALAALGCGGGTEVTTVPKERVADIVANFNGQTIFGVDSIQAYAAAYGPTGDSLSDRIVSLTALTPTVATITAAGVIHTRAEGLAQFAATADGFTDTLSLRVFLRRVARVTASPDSTSLAVGDTLTVYPVAHAYDASGREMENVAIGFKVVNDSTLALFYNPRAGITASHVGTALLVYTADTAVANVKVTVTAAAP